MPLNYHHLRYFWAVAHEGNLTRAAARLNVSQSALSSQIQKLEDRLGHALFERRGKQLVLTEAGRVALDHADTIFAAGAELVETLKGGVAPPRQVLRVGALSTLSRNFQVGFLRPILGRDDVELVVRTGSLATLLPALESHELDVVLTNRAPLRDAATPWVTHTVAEQRVALVGPPTRVHPGASVTDLLERHPLIVPSFDSGIRASLDSLLVRLRVRPRIVAEADDMAMIRALAREDLGLAVAPPIVMRGEVAAGTLVVAGDLPGLIETFHAVTLDRRFPHPLLREVLGRPIDATAQPVPPPSY
ncbi:LysR family transcriptional regulator [Roseospira navarrensis]|uniref:LysR family transcriptional regulator n=1 Tax=Roseospira navarrensis TaxID=140058 RepID=A0A7X1ZC64_9PROT|nr:LysR family transcriptional regulator [Roseospira navarrensis]MQX35846.1 LysR family transcriptional regulator [Roseospira navarrensis]